MKTIKKDIIKAAQDGEIDVLVHGANCFHTFGAGIAKQIKKVYPGAYTADLDTPYGNDIKLGTYSSYTDGNVTIVNGYTQFRYGKNFVNVKQHADYDAIRFLFMLISKDFMGERIGFPKIGCGLAGGQWGIVSRIIEEELEGEDYCLYVI